MNVLITGSTGLVGSISVFARNLERSGRRFQHPRPEETPGRRFGQEERR
ncbi:MAG: hypothetical protein QM330_03335 [Acidobacteriota bacterium]|jgi:uncharacterized protein YbjT (DUF2867 family)|nr:hypothetical protein [Acidobacteriota bacterium]NLT33624.1 hypothetical protein [Acidobacteriota bacterium]